MKLRTLLFVAAICGFHAATALPAFGHEGRPGGRHGERRPGPRSPGSLIQAFDSNGDGSVSAAELSAGLAARQAEMLKDVDTNADGAISAEELAKIDERRAERLKGLDSDGDGAVSASELAANVEKRKTEILAKLDTNADGSISAEEIAAYRPEGSDRPFSRGRSLRELDADKNGTVSGEELSAGLAARQADWLKVVDTSGDGAISKQELAALGDRFAAKVKELDTDGDGAVSAAELAAHLEARKKEILERFDTNGDGALGPDELAPAPAGCMDRGEEEEAAREVEAQALLFSQADILRGDVNADDAVNITDALNVTAYLFLGAAAPSCLDTADADDDGAVNLSDAVVILETLFLGTSPGIAAPYPARGPDPSADSLPCQ